MTNTALGTLLEALAPDGPISHNYQATPADRFNASVVDPLALPARVDAHMLCSQWMSIATIDPGITTGRGEKADIRRLMALPCDFDVKAGSFTSKEAIDSCIDEIIANIGFQPVITVDTGHGLQPWWPLSKDDPAWRCDSAADPRWSAINAILSRWKRYVRWECEKHGASMDGVFDASRVMRIPNTLNTKEDVLPVVVRHEYEDWEPITHAALDEALTALGFPELPEDVDVLGDQVFDFDGFTPPVTTCAYAKGIITGLASEVPGPTGRHPWLTGKATRLWALYRYGCVAQDDLAAVMVALRTRFLELCADPRIGGGVRAEGPNEVKDAIRDMRSKVATWTPEKVTAEFTTAAGAIHDHHQPTIPIFADQIAQYAASQATITPNASPTAPASTLAKSEDGHSQQLIAEFGNDIKYCPERGRWLHWNGSIWQWQPAGGGIVRELSKVVARRYPDGDGWDAFKKRCLSSSGVTACLSLSETDHRVAVSIHDLDARPWELNTPGGIIDLRTGALRSPDPRSLHTKTTLCTPDPAADQGVWLEFLADTFNADAEMTGWLQRLFGYTCVGEVREAILPLFFGLGANGKTTILETISGLLADYATEAPQGFLVQGPAQHPAEIAELAGARMVIASETNEDQKFDEAKVKQLTGGDRLRGRFMRQDWFSFAPSHTLFLMTNHRPEVRSGGHGFWRRVREVPFRHEVPAHKKIEKYQDVLIGEHGPAIMAWLAQGAAQYAATGLKDPASVRVATSEYQASTDTITRFVEDMCVIGGGEHVKTNSSKVRAAYELWCEQEGETPISSKAMTMQLAVKFGVGKARDMRARFLTNVSLADASEDDEGRFR